MRLRHVAAALVPAGAASALAILPVSGAVAAAPATAHLTAAHKMIPAVSAPHAYKYAGQVNGAATTFSCQEPGSSINCYAPQELATAYDIPSKLTGAGQTIVIIDAFGDPDVAADLGVEDTAFGLPAANLNILYPAGQPTFDPTNADEVGWSGEIALDVESAHAIAPAATIDLVIAKSDQDADIETALKYVVAHRLGSVLSQSYGEAEACEDPTILKTEHLLYAAAALEQVSVFASSGDVGAAQYSCDGSSYVKAVSTPASDPLVTVVGATSLTAHQTDGAYESETAWNDEYGSSGGGYSSVYSRPLYQLGLNHTSARGVPDVAYSGDVNNGLLIAWSQGDPTQLGSIYVFGGTSAGSPQWAAITALADESAHHPLGFLNDDLYLLARSPAIYNYVFHDTTTGDNTFGGFTGYSATKGWDPVTGLGTPDVAHLLKFL